MRTSAAVAIAVALATVAFLVGAWYNGHQTAASPVEQAGQGTLYYACPMHPQYRSDKPGDCVSCGMRLEPVYAEGAESRAGSEGSNAPGTVLVSGAKQQLLGVRTDTVKSAPSAHLLRAPGRVTVDEQRQYRIVAAVDGWIRELGPNSAGTFVREKEILGSYYAQDFVATQQALLFALGTSDQLRRGQVVVGTDRPSANLNVQIAVDSLRNLGMNDLQIEELQKTKASISQIDIYSPVSGFVIERNVSPAQRFDKGVELYRIADISHVWVMVDIFEKDLEVVKPGAKATIRFQGHEFPSRVGDVLPQVDPVTRTLKVRFEAVNRGNLLRPDMFVDVELPVSLPDAITVPVDAVIDSGLNRTVYVAKGGGYFEPRSVETGWRFGDQVEVVKGLMPGEQVVVSGNFLLDSESRMRVTGGQGEQATMGQGDMVTDPVCGMEIDPAKAAGKSEYKGQTYYFCSDQCKREFDKNPGAVLSKKAS